MYMQPMLMIRSVVPGMVYINGRFAGEADFNNALSIPVTSRGTLYIELKPLQGGYLPLSRRIALSGGRAVTASLTGQTGLNCILWPGSVVELELTPERLQSTTTPKVLSRDFDGLSVRLIQTDQCRLELSRGTGFTLHSLPNGANPPDLRQLQDGSLQFFGTTADGAHYLIAVSQDLDQATLNITGREIDQMPDGSIRVLTDIDDLVGHARLLTFYYADGQYHPGEPETLWAHGAPSWPDTPEDTAIAALEAALLGLYDEASAYFAPGFPTQPNPALSEANSCDGCVRLKYALPDGKQAVGLLRLLGENCAEILPVTYHAIPVGGGQGTWRIDQMELAQET